MTGQDIKEMAKRAKANREERQMQVGLYLVQFEGPVLDHKDYPHSSLTTTKQCHTKGQL